MIHVEPKNFQMLTKQQAQTLRQQAETIEASPQAIIPCRNCDTVAIATNRTSCPACGFNHLYINEDFVACTGPKFI